MGMTTMKDSVKALVDDGTINESTAQEYLQTSTSEAPTEEGKPAATAAKPRNNNDF
jgi:hypothetical protein